MIIYIFWFFLFSLSDKRMSSLEEINQRYWLKKYFCFNINFFQISFLLIKSHFRRQKNTTYIFWIRIQSYSKRYIHPKKLLIKKMHFFSVHFRRVIFRNFVFCFICFQPYISMHHTHTHTHTRKHTLHIQNTLLYIYIYIYIYYIYIYIYI